MPTKMQAILTIVLLVIVTRTVSQVCNYENSVELVDRSNNGIKYEDDTIFVDNRTGMERGCVCMKKSCVRKCCLFGQGYDKNTKQCVDVSKILDAPVWDGFNTVPGLNITKEFHFLFFKMNCSSELNEVRVPFRASNAGFRLTTNGHLQVEITTGNYKSYGPDKYCIDNFVWDNPNEPQLSALICYTPVVEKEHHRLSSTCMLISCFFIVLTVAVYACLPRNLHAMVLMAYLLSFLVGFVFMATMQILILHNAIPAEMCLTFTFIIYFSLLSAFFWLNVMCFDIWYTFSGKRSPSGGPSSPHARFKSYSMYAFGVPSALTILLAVLEFSINPNRSKFLPRLLLQGCFISGNSKLLYFYGPIVILCVANMIFFVLTALKIADTKRQAQKVLNKKDKQRFSLYIKLFVVMGVNWILEVVSSFFPEADYIWQFTDAYNVLVGLIIFIIFVCKMKTFNLIKDRIRNYPRSSTNTGEMKDISNTRFDRFRNSQGVRTSIDTIRTTLGLDADSKSVTSDKSNNIIG